MSQFFRQLRWELYRMFARRRTYIGFAIFLLVEMLFFFLWTRTSFQGGLRKMIEQLAGGFEDYFSALTLAFLIVSLTMFFLGMIFVSLVAGDILAKESEDGNLRLLLVRPVSRFQLLLTKFIACHLYSTCLFCFVGISSLLFGILGEGWGGNVFVWIPGMPRPSLFDWDSGFWRYWLTIGGFSLIYLPVTGTAFFFSCLKIKPAAATVVTVAIFLGDWIFGNIWLPAFDPYREYFITSRMDAWLFLLYQDIPWPAFFEAWVWLTGFGITGFLLGWIVFERRDVKS